MNSYDNLHDAGSVPALPVIYMSSGPITSKNMGVDYRFHSTQSHPVQNCVLPNVAHPRLHNSFRPTNVALQRPLPSDPILLNSFRPTNVMLTPRSDIRNSFTIKDPKIDKANEPCSSTSDNADNTEGALDASDEPPTTKYTGRQLLYYKPKPRGAVEGGREASVTIYLSSDIEGYDNDNDNTGTKKVGENYHLDILFPFEDQVAEMFSKSKPQPNKIENAFQLVRKLVPVLYKTKGFECNSYVKVMSADDDTTAPSQVPIRTDFIEGFNWRTVPLVTASGPHEITTNSVEYYEVGGGSEQSTGTEVLSFDIGLLDYDLEHDLDATYPHSKPASIILDLTTRETSSHYVNNSDENEPYYNNDKNGNSTVSAIFADDGPTSQKLAIPGCHDEDLSYEEQPIHVEGPHSFSYYLVNNSGPSLKEVGTDAIYPSLYISNTQLGNEDSPTSSQVQQSQINESPINSTDGSPPKSSESSEDMTVIESVENTMEMEIFERKLLDTNSTIFQQTDTVKRGRGRPKGVKNNIGYKPRQRRRFSPPTDKATLVEKQSVVRRKTVNAQRFCRKERRINFPVHVIEANEVSGGHGGVVEQVIDNHHPTTQKAPVSVHTKKRGRPPGSKTMVRNNIEIRRSKRIENADKKPVATITTITKNTKIEKSIADKSPLVASATTNVDTKSVSSMSSVSVSKILYPRACELCNQTIRQRQHWRNHELTKRHMAKLSEQELELLMPRLERRYTCEICHRTFSRKRLYDRHVARNSCTFDEKNRKTDVLKWKKLAIKDKEEKEERVRDKREKEEAIMSIRKIIRNKMIEMRKLIRNAKLRIKRRVAKNGK